MRESPSSAPNPSVILLVGACAHQSIGNFALVPCPSGLQWRDAGAVGRIGIGAAPQQLAYVIQATLQDGGHQGGASFGIPSIDTNQCIR